MTIVDTDQEALARGVALVPEMNDALNWSKLYAGPRLKTEMIEVGSEALQTIIAALEAAERLAKPAIPEGMDVVERVARALMKARHPTWIWEDCGAYYPMFMEYARAALAAIKPEKEQQ